MAAARNKTDESSAAPRTRRATAAKSRPAGAEAPAKATAPAAAAVSRAARHGADPAAAKQRKATTAKVAATMAATTTHAGEDATLVAKSTAGLTVAPHDQHPGHTAHPRGHDVDQQVKSLAHIYTPWANVRANGSGIVALAAWARRLENEGKVAASEAGTDIVEFIRGLTHR
jgi:hypothetical protein